MAEALSVSLAALNETAEPPAVQVVAAQSDADLTADLQAWATARDW